MGVERGNESGGGMKEERVRDLEKGEVGFEERKTQRNDVDGDDDDDTGDIENVDHGHGHGHGDAHGNHDDEEFNLSRFHRLNPTNPLRIVINSSTRAGRPSPPAQSQRSHTHTRSVPTQIPIATPAPAPIQTPQPPPPQVCFF